MNNFRLAMIFAIALLSGCAHYTTPGGAVPLAGIDDSGIEEAFSRQPAAHFPAGIAIVRVQDPGYESRTYSGHSLGRFSVVSVRDIESDDALARMQALSNVRGVAPLTSLLLPTSANSIRDLRKPAAQLQADLLLVYSVDTQFHVDGKALGPLSLISLGLLPNKTAHVSATVAGVLVDVRTGFIYGVVEGSALEQQRASLWSTELATDTARLRAEALAFESFVSEFGDFWDGVLLAHASPRAAGPRYASGSP